MKRLTVVLLALGILLFSACGDEERQPPHPETIEVQREIDRKLESVHDRKTELKRLYKIADAYVEKYYRQYYSKRHISVATYCEVQVLILIELNRLESKESE